MQQSRQMEGLSRQQADQRTGKDTEEWSGAVAGESIANPGKSSRLMMQRRWFDA
jgi:hypothetical protein